MYAEYRKYYRSKYGFFNFGETGSRDVTTLPKWRYNKTKPAYSHAVSTFYDFGFEPSNDAPFKILEVDLKKDSNREAHHTDQYEQTNLVVRRGQQFNIEVKVDKKFEKENDVIRLQFGTGEQPKETKDTMFVIAPSDAISTENASAVIEDVTDDGSGSVVKMSVSLPCDCVVGRFTLFVRMQNRGDQTTQGGRSKYVSYKVEEPIFVLFNPWCQDDMVYLEDDSQRTEYVLNDTGLIYRGKGSNPRPKKWVFGQFEPQSLEVALQLLERSELPVEAFGNAIRVTRCLSAMVNSFDGGVLTGNWSGDYEGGTAPTEWNGSTMILEQWLATKTAVDYGQCWVFSGVTTTVCRALGIPTRSVTNFNSAHDTDSSMTIDFHRDAEGNSLKWLNDSIWNFHVWNEAWFKRPDLPEGNDGWQAFDATPQEESDGQMQCGPAPLLAIKSGNVHFGYDTKFVFAEVNGDAVTWEVTEDESEMSVIRIDPDRVGANISTKAVGKAEREDVTALYKHAEGSKEERKVIHKVSNRSTRKKALQDYYDVGRASDVNMTFEGSVDSTANGVFTFRAKNTSSDPRTVSVLSHLVAKYYTGVDADDLGHERKTFNLEPNGEAEHTWKIAAADWLNRIHEDAEIGSYCHAKVWETKQIFADEQTYELEKPDLHVAVSKDTVKKAEEFEATIKFQNPLDIPLTKASFMLEGAGFVNPKKVHLGRDIAPHEEVSMSIKVTPKMAGQREIIVSFHSRQLINIEGSASVNVTA